MIEKIYKEEYSKVLATLIKLLGDFDLAEDALQESFAIAASDWNEKGIPQNPYSWLVSVGRNKAIDKIRKEKKGHEIYQRLEIVEAYELDENLDKIDDDQLRLIFLCCHPQLTLESKIALSLKEVCGLSIEQIAKAFLCGNEAIRKRIYRAKQTIKEKNIEFELPNKSLLKERLDSVLHVIYLIFNEGYTLSNGEQTINVSLMDESIYFINLINKLIPSSEGLGLHALFCFQKSRTKSRLNENFELVSLDKQNRNLWDQRLIAQGLMSLQDAILTGPLGPYSLQACIASVHSTSESFEKTNWELVVNYYDMLFSINASPVIELNKSVAIGYLNGASEALKILDRLEKGKLKNYQPLYSIKAEFLYRDEQVDESKKYFETAIELSTQEQEKTYLNQRLKEVLNKCPN